MGQGYYGGFLTDCNNYRNACNGTPGNGYEGGFLGWYNPKVSGIITSELKSNNFVTYISDSRFGRYWENVSDWKYIRGGSDYKIGFKTNVIDKKGNSAFGQYKDKVTNWLIVYCYWRNN